MRVDINGIGVHYELEGPEGSPLITFSNSIAADLHLWDAQAEAFGRDFRVLRYDMRGHGETGGSPPPYDMGLLVNDVLGLWDALGIWRSHFVGLSLGGMVAAGLALDHPDRLMTVTIANSRLEADDTFRATWDQRVDLARAEGMGALVDSTIARWVTPEFIENDPDGVARIKAMVGGCSLNGFEGAARALQGLDYLKRIDEIKLPALFIAGREDGACPPDGIKAAADRVAGAEYAELSPAAHISCMEQPEAFNRHLREFLARHANQA